MTLNRICCREGSEHLIQYLSQHLSQLNGGDDIGAIADPSALLVLARLSKEYHSDATSHRSGIFLFNLLHCSRSRIGFLNDAERMLLDPAAAAAAGAAAGAAAAAFEDTPSGRWAELQVCVCWVRGWVGGWRNIST